MREVVFHAPVFVGDLVSFWTRTQRVGTTSATVHVEVEAERGHPGGPRVKVTEAEVVFVHVGQDGRPLPIPRPAAG
jgi:acyl-CoA thioesterase YciA